MSRKDIQEEACKVLVCDKLICNKVVEKKPRLGIRLVHLLLSFLVGMSLAVGFHAITLNRKVRQVAESVCERFASDKEVCKSGIDSIMDIANNEVQNNINFTE